MPFGVGDIEESVRIYKLINKHCHSLLEENMILYNIFLFSHGPNMSKLKVFKCKSDGVRLKTSVYFHSLSTFLIVTEGRLW